METIVTLTSHGRRLGFVHIVLGDLVRICEPRGIMVSLSVQEDEVGKLSQETNDLIVGDKVELITVKRDYGPATKQIPCRLAHPDAHLIVMDDDVLLREDGVDKIIRYRKDYKNDVLGFRARKIEIEDGRLKPFIGFIWSDADKYATQLITGGDVSEPTRMFDVFFEHVGVVSYPPGYARLSPDEWRMLVDKAPNDDDVVMQVVNMRYGFSTVLIPGSCVRRNIGVVNPIIGSDSLYASSNNGRRTAKAMLAFEEEFISYVNKGGKK